jgi:hypothetical protein
VTDTMSLALRLPRGTQSMPRLRVHRLGGTCSKLHHCLISRLGCRRTVWCLHLRHCIPRRYLPCLHRLRRPALPAAQRAYNYVVWSLGLRQYDILASTVDCGLEAVLIWTSTAVALSTLFEWKTAAMDLQNLVARCVNVSLSIPNHRCGDNAPSIFMLLT